MKGEKYHFDEAAADRVCQFFERYLVHSKGEWAGQPFELQPWQRKILRDVFGWKRKDGRRRYRRLYLEIARGNGKSFLASALALYLLMADGEAGAEVYSCAASAGQASIVFDEAKRMLQASPKLCQHAQPYRHSIIVPRNHSSYRVLSADADIHHGLNAHGILFDELHTQRSRDLWDVMTTSTIKRRNPLVVALTTSGHDQLSICYELHEHAQRVAADPDHDPEFYPALFCADKADPIDAEGTWRKANPNLGVSIKAEDMAVSAAKAKAEPSFENTFRRLHLCQWTEQATRFLNLDTYDANTRAIDPAELTGQPCVVGLDLSQSYDLTAVVAVFARSSAWLVVPRLYCPRDTAERRTRDDGIPYTSWIESGAVIATEGATIDYDRIEADILELARTYRVQEVAYDPYNANAITSHLEAAGIVTVPVRQDYQNMSRAAKEFERRLTNGTITVAENPCMRWQAANVEVEADNRGNIRPVKPKARGRYAGTSKLKVDGIVATITAISRAMLQPEQQGETIGNAIVWI